MNIELDTYKRCSVDGCPLPCRSATMCSAHYFQVKRNGKITKLDLKRTPKKCSVELCNSVEYAKGFCIRHYDHVKNYGEIRHTAFDRNIINEKGEYSELICETKDGRKIVSLVDNEDVVKIKKYKWHVGSGEYVSNPKMGRLSRFLMDLSRGFAPNDRANTFSEEVDHINRNRLDNRKSNLRIVTRLGNMQNKNVYQNNSTGHVGVGLHGLTGKWFYQLSYGGASEISTLYEDKNTAIQNRERDITLLKDSKTPEDTYKQIVSRMREEKEERHAELYERIEKCCAYCNQMFLAAGERRKKNGKYCSLDCYWKSNKGKRIACQRKD